MDTPHLLKARLHWVQLYLCTGHAGLTCLRCGISQPTLRKGGRRYKEHGIDELRSLSRCPTRITGLKRTQELQGRVMQLRTEPRTRAY